MNNNKNKDGNKEASRKMLLNVPLSLHNALILSQANDYTDFTLQDVLLDRIKKSFIVYPISTDKIIEHNKVAI
jgi:hypothetical protein